MAGKVFKAHLETDLVGVVALGRESVSSSSRSGCFLHGSPGLSSGLPFFSLRRFTRDYSGLLGITRDYSAASARPQLSHVRMLGHVGYLFPHFFGDMCGLEAH